MKSKNKLKKLLIILNILLFSFILGLIYINFKSKDVLAWYNSSWLYRRSITITGDGNSYTNLDVLVNINTSTLVSASKLQSDCDDLRFTDSDGDTALGYWVEGGCNTTSTKIWVRVPTMTTTDKTIYVYYGNSSATNSEASWTGSFLALADSSCTNDWTRDSTYDSKFIYGSTTYASTWGSPSSHDHGGSFSGITSGGPSTTTTSKYGTTYTYYSKDDHTHTVAGTIASGDSTPPYISMIVCKKTKLTTLTNLIFLTDSSTPTGWSRFSALDDRFPYGGSSYGTTGGTTSHDHTIGVTSVSFYSAPRSRMEDGGSSNSMIGSHSHSGSGSTNSISNHPPYKTLLYIKSPTLTSLDQRIISLSTSTPPYGWTQYSDLNSFFVLGGSSVNLTAQGNSTHSHTVSITLSSNSVFDPVTSYSGSVARSDHFHSVSFASSSASLIPPYATTVYIKRNTSLTTTVSSTEEQDNTAPYAPSSLLTEGLTNPINVSDLTPEFTSTYTDPNSDNAGHYEIEVNTAEDFTGTVMWDSGQTAVGSTLISGGQYETSYSSSTALSANGALYYWRMRYWDNKGLVSDWSEVASFRMQRQPSPPTILYVDGFENPLAINSNTPIFSAIYNDINEHSATAYEIEVNTNNTFTGTVMWDTGKVSTTVTQGTRSPNYTYAGTTLTDSLNTYYWRIRFWDVDNLTGDWSDVNTFVDSPNHTYMKGLQLKGLQID